MKYDGQQLRLAGMDAILLPPYHHFYTVTTTAAATTTTTNTNTTAATTISEPNLKFVQAAFGMPYHGEHPSVPALRYIPFKRLRLVAHHGKYCGRGKALSS